MKNDKKWFILIELILAVLVFVLAFIMIQEKYGNNRNRIAVIMQDSESTQWAAFRYGLEKAAEDRNVELFITATQGQMTVEDQKELILEEISNGADAVIVQPLPGAEAEKMLKKAGKKLPIVLVETTVGEKTAPTAFPVLAPDHYAMGVDLAKELLQDYSGRVEGKTVGILAEEESSRERKQGVLDTLEGTGAVIEWALSDGEASGEGKLLERQKRVDFVIALDDRSLYAAGELAVENNLHGALIYGVGRTTKAVYYLDAGYAKCLVVPDDFSMGYQSLTEAAEAAGSFSYVGENQTVSHKVLRRETLFLKENQEILFTMSQE